MAAITPNNRDEQDEAYNPYRLHAAEQFSDGPASHSTDTSETPNDKSKNIDDAKEGEQNPGPWKTTVIRGGKSEGKKQIFVGKIVKKKYTPAALIASLLFGGIAGIGTVLSPAGALLHIKSVVVDKFDSMSSVVTSRSDLALEKRMFGTNAACKIKIRCRFSGLTQRQMDRLTNQEAKLVDANGKEVTKNKLGRYTGGKTLILADGQKINAGSYKKALAGNASLRDLSRKVFAPRWLSWNDDISKKIREKFKLDTDHKWGKEGDKKEANKSIYNTESGGASGGEVTTEENVPADENEDDGDKDKKPVGENADIGDLGPAVQAEGEKLTKLAADGEDVPQIPSDPAGAAMMPDFDSGGLSLKKGFNSVVGFLNPLAIVSSMCTIYQLTHAIVLTAKTVALVNTMRFASIFLSTADKLFAGLASSDEVEKAMNILQKLDKWGNAFGDAVGYQFPEYGIVPDIAIASSAAGNAVIQVFSSALNYVNNFAPGGAKTIRTACNILTNPFVQGGLALTTFIPGVGGAMKGLTSILAKGGKDVAVKLVKDEIKKVTEKVAANASKDAIKDSAKAATKTLVKMAAGPAGMFLAGYLFTKYGVPYMARQLYNVDLTGSVDGVKAMDAIANGTDATNSATSQERGLAPLTVDESKAFNQFNNKSTATYVADMRAESNPFNINDPYSAGNSIASAFFTFGSKVNLQNGASNILSMPAAILSSLNPSNLLAQNANALGDPGASSYCTVDQFLIEHNMATSPFCNVQYGFNDTNMLENTDPDQVIDWMLNSNQIDDDGEPVADSDFATFKSTCVDDSSGKIISDLGEDDQRLDPSCYGDKNKTEAYKMYRLYVIDTGVSNAMDLSMADDGGNANETEAAPADTNSTTADPSAFVPDMNPAATTASTIVSAQSPVSTAVVCTGLEQTDSLADFVPYGTAQIKSNYTKKWEVSYAA